jgi:hypothetical protein
MHRLDEGGVLEVGLREKELDVLDPAFEHRDAYAARALNH